MEYINAAFARMNLYQISNFFLYGVDGNADNAIPYSDALRKGCDPIYRRLDIMYPDITERDKAAADLSLAFAVYENVYMQLGMKAGARLIQQLLLDDDRHCAENTNDKP